RQAASAAWALVRSPWALLHPVEIHRLAPRRPLPAGDGARHPIGSAPDLGVRSGTGGASVVPPSASVSYGPSPVSPRPPPVSPRPLPVSGWFYEPFRGGSTTGTTTTRPPRRARRECP